MTTEPTVGRSRLTTPFVAAALIGALFLWSIDGSGGALAAATVILGYWIAVGARTRWSFGEDAADSAYFLGFIFTVSLLAFSFMRLSPGEEKATLERVLEAVGRALLLTVWGLFWRQVAMLMNSRTSDQHGRDALMPDPLTTIRSAEQNPPSRPNASHAETEATDQASKAVSTGARKLELVADQIERAAVALAGAAERIGAAAGSLVANVEDSTAHISGASQQSAVALISAAQEMQRQLRVGAEEVARGFGSITSSLEAHGKLLWAATDREAAAGIQGLERLGQLGEHAREMSAAAIQALSESAKTLAARANALPDPRGPTIAYSEALQTAAKAIALSGEEASRAGNVVASNLDKLGANLKSMSGETESVLNTTRTALERARGHFELFKRLEDEYVQLIEDLSDSARGARKGR